MAESRPLPGGELEYAVLTAIWDAETISAPDLHAVVGAPRGLAYTTTAKVLDRLHHKRLVARRRVGQSFVYKAKVSRESIDRARTGNAIRALLGSSSPVPAIATLVDTLHQIDPKLVDELSKQVAAHRKARRGS